jgi:cytochrome c biogenesis protein CcmG, thiol:disulfide interchange protein DsbE
MGVHETPLRLARRGVFWLALLLIPVAGAAELKSAGGTRALPLSLKTLDGATHDLAKYRGKVVLVNFWATWCEPCRDEMPSIERLKEKFAGQPFEVLAVNVDEPESRVRAFLAKTPLQLTVVLDPGKAVTKNWNARILPASFVVGRDGRVRYSVLGEMDWSLESNAKVIDALMRQR